MEKRFVLFLILTMIIVVGYNAFVATFGPPRPPADKLGEQVAADKHDPDKTDADKTNAEKDLVGEKPPGEGTAGNTEKSPVEKPSGENEKPQEKPAESNAASRVFPHRYVTLGSYLQSSSSPLMVVLNSRGATLERVEFVERTSAGELRYRDLENSAGYLGNLSLAQATPSGCVIQNVPPGTPAAELVAVGADGATRLQKGDILLTVDGHDVAEPHDLDLALVRRKPQDEVKLVVQRTVDGKTQTIQFAGKLSERPLELIRPEPLEKGEVEPHPLSMQLSLGDTTRAQQRALAGLHYVDWEVVEPAGANRGVAEFRYTIDAQRATDFGLSQPVEVIKRYRLGTAQELPAGKPNLPYHLNFEFEFRNLGTLPQKISYVLDGTNGLPTEGWWYSTKIHPKMFQSAGARDIAIRTVSAGHLLYGCPGIVSYAKKNENAPETIADNAQLQMIGVDAQYFAAALLPVQQEGTGGVAINRAETVALGDVDKKPKGWERTANVSYRVHGVPVTLESNASHREAFTLFLGPKEPDLLASYGLSDLIYHGWFAPVSRFLSGLLHLFHDRMVGNYAIAIIMLTVLVRGVMFPLSRKAAKNAAMMQELAPEMRKIAEKFKSNMEARGKAQQELFRKHNYNPFSGCWMMFLQLPVFIGLYRCLAIDIKLRQAPLIHGVEWASNLAGPDKMFYWGRSFLAFLTDESGWLGPYFNLLPIFTIGLFLVHQKLFTPPATDEQTAMQLKMMKFMTVFMGVLFYKVPAGLCIYFIASSLWGIAERKLLPKPKPSSSTEPPSEPPKKKPFSFTNPFAPKTDGNGSSPRRRPSKRPKRKPQ